MLSDDLYSIVTSLNLQDFVKSCKRSEHASLPGTGAADSRGSRIRIIAHIRFNKISCLKNTRNRSPIGQSHTIAREEGEPQRAPLRPQEPHGHLWELASSSEANESGITESSAKRRRVAA